MTAQTKVVISTVGPFMQYGEPLVAACIKQGTHYVDSTGETPFVNVIFIKDLSPLCFCNDINQIGD